MSLEVDVALKRVIYVIYAYVMSTCVVLLLFLRRLMFFNVV